MKATILIGNALLRLPQLAGCSVESIVTDPPYELGFMGKSWDSTGIAYDVSLWRECLRVLKPGGHLLSFGGSRTYHRMACAIEDAGFEIRDQIQWIFGSGFPKSKNLSGDWDGWGTALKPAHEPVCMARKPFRGTVAANVLEYRTGALNIDGCRIDGHVPAFDYFETGSRRGYEGGIKGGARSGESREGRWPANVIHDGSEEVLECFPDAVGQQGPPHVDPEDRKTQGIYGVMKRGNNDKPPRGDEGSAARFFYCAKTSQEERNRGLDGMPTQVGGMVSNTSGQHITRRDGGAPGPRENYHPTVKPSDLMCYLVRLVTPPGGTVLDPFLGSGSTGIAAMREGFDFVGIEVDPAYAEIAKRRVDHEGPLLNEVKVFSPDLIPEEVA